MLKNKKCAKVLTGLLILIVSCISETFLVMYLSKVGIFRWLWNMSGDFFLVAYTTSYSIVAIAVFYLWTGLDKWMVKKGIQIKYLFVKLYITMAILAYGIYRYTSYKKRSLGIAFFTILSVIILLAILELQILRCLVLKIKQNSNLSYASFVLLGASAAWFMMHAIIWYLYQKQVYYIRSETVKVIIADCAMGFIGAVVWGTICVIKIKRQKNNAADTEKLSVRKGVLICILSVVMLSFSLCKFIGFEMSLSGQW